MCTGTEVAPPLSSMAASFWSLAFMETPGPWDVGDRGWSRENQVGRHDLGQTGDGNRRLGPRLHEQARARGWPPPLAPSSATGSGGGSPGTAAVVVAMAGRTTGTGTARVTWRDTRTTTRLASQTPDESMRSGRAVTTPAEGHRLLPVRQLFVLLGCHENSPGLGALGGTHDPSSFEEVHQPTGA